MTIKWTVNTTQLQRRVTGLKSVVDSVMPAVYKEFVDNTPVRSGNARRSTTLSKRTITARYPYAEVLDKGRGFRDGQMRGSNQAPVGMTKPTRDYAIMLIQSAIRQIRGN